MGSYGVCEGIQAGHLELCEKVQGRHVGCVIACKGVGGVYEGVNGEHMGWLRRFRGGVRAVGGGSEGYGMCEGVQRGHIGCMSGRKVVMWGV